MSLIRLRVFVHVCILVYRGLFAGESGRWVMWADGSPWIRFRGAGKDPAVGRTLTHLGGLCGWALDQQHHHDGIRDEAVIWNGCAVDAVCVFVFAHLCVCHFLVIRLDVGHWTFHWLHTMEQCNHMPSQGHITSHPPSHISCYCCYNPCRPAHWSEFIMNCWIHSADLNGSTGVSQAGLTTLPQTWVGNGSDSDQHWWIGLSIMHEI